MNYASIFHQLPTSAPTCSVFSVEVYFPESSWKLEESWSIAPSLLAFYYIVLGCLAIDLGHFTVLFATFRLYSDNLFQATEKMAHIISYLYLYSE